jgi:hypothetical protein
MKIIRKAKVVEYESYELEVTEELAQECETALKRAAINPKEVPHLSVQTLAQCWEDDGSVELLDYIIEVQGYHGSYQQHLTEWVHDWLNDVVWELEPYYGDREIVDWDDDLEWEDDDEWNMVYRESNPDFDYGKDEDVVSSPESTND